VFCDVGRPVLWLPALSVVDGIWWMPECSGHREKKKKKKKKKKKMPAVFWVVEKLLCGPLLLLLLLFLYWPEVSVFSGKFRWSPAMLQRVSGEPPVTVLFCFFNVLLLFLGTAGLFYVFSASAKAPTKLCIFRQVSGDAPVKFSVAVPFWILARCQPSWISARCWPLLDFGKLSALLDFGPLSALLDFGPLSALLDFGPLLALLDFGPLSALLDFGMLLALLDFGLSAHCRPLLDFGPLLASFGFWLVVGPFWSLAHCWPF
jgi:hypothetical protein